MIDFWLANAKLTGDGGEYRVKYTVDNGEAKFIDKWAPIWLTGWISGRHVVVVGRGLTIGRPLANILALKKPGLNAAVTVVHTGVDDLGRYTRDADILVAAAGSPGLITADMVQRGAAVVAAGVSFRDGKLMSDVADDVADVAGWLSPRIGGVGPMTRAMLMANTVAAAERAAG